MLYLQYFINCINSNHVGTMMMRETSEIDWNDIRSALPAYITICLMPFTYSIPNGIAFGTLISFLLFVFTGGLFPYIQKWIPGSKTKDYLVVDFGSIPDSPIEEKELLFAPEEYEL